MRASFGQRLIAVVLGAGFAAGAIAQEYHGSVVGARFDAGTYGYGGFPRGGYSGSGFQGVGAFFHGPGYGAYYGPGGYYLHGGYRGPGFSIGITYHGPYGDYYDYYDAGRYYGRGGYYGQGGYRQLGGYYGQPGYSGRNGHAGYYGQDEADGGSRAYRVDGNGLYVDASDEYGLRGDGSGADYDVGLDDAIGYAGGAIGGEDLGAGQDEAAAVQGVTMRCAVSGRRITGCSPAADGGLVAGQQFGTRCIPGPTWGWTADGTWISPACGRPVP